MSTVIKHCTYVWDHYEINKWIKAKKTSNILSFELSEQVPFHNLP